MHIVKGSPKEHFFMLFNDALVIAKVKKLNKRSNLSGKSHWMVFKSWPKEFQKQIICWRNFV